MFQAADFIAMKQNFGMTGVALWSAGNFTVYTVGDGAVDWADLQILMSNFGTTEPSGVEMAPEPATLAMLALGGLAMLRRRR